MNGIVVVKKQIADITWNKEEALKEAQKIMQKYDGIVFSEEQLPEAKSEIAALRKVSKEINSQALAIDKELTAPVKQFREEVKEVKAIVDSGISYIDSQIKEYEEKLKLERKKEIMSWEEWQDIKDYGVFDDSWLLKKWKDKDLKELFKDTKSSIDSAINTISLLATTNGLDKEFYINKLKLQSLEQVVERITEDIANLTKQEVKEEVVIDTTEEQVTITRYLTGTVSSLKALKKYADQLGIKWSDTK